MIPVHGYDGLRGTIEGPPPGPAGQVEIVLVGGARIRVPMAVLTPDGEDGYLLPMSLADVQRAFATQTGDREALVIPVVEEHVEIGKRVVDAGRVRIRKVVTERTEEIDQPLSREEVNVERVAVNRYVDAPPQVRTEGDTLIVPLLEEVLVVQKRLVLREELRITKRLVPREHEAARVTLRREDVEIERVDADPSHPQRRG